MNTDGIPDIVVDGKVQPPSFTRISETVPCSRALRLLLKLQLLAVSLWPMWTQTGLWMQSLPPEPEITSTSLQMPEMARSSNLEEITLSEAAVRISSSIFPGKTDGNNSYDFLAINGVVSEIFTNDGIGNFVVSTNLPAPVATASDAAIGDINGNGTNDLAFSCGTRSRQAIGIRHHDQQWCWRVSVLFNKQLAAT